MKTIFWLAGVIAICTTICVFLITKSEAATRDYVNSKFESTMHERELMRQDIKELRSDMKATNGLIRDLLLELRRK